jgi:hypothetical protein
MISFYLNNGTLPGIGRLGQEIFVSKKTILMVLPFVAEPHHFDAVPA